jgi:acetyl/propionyl-CoA carboxylase alpha subunit
VIEETPSPLLDTELREKMGRAAVAAARAIGYQNAGTVEFIVDPATRDFFFLEMNTRLQVEHPVTEWTTGLDLVKSQIRIAEGEPLAFRQEDLAQRGHAIEARVYAEDPANGFLPESGRILQLELPARPGVRSDSGIETGDDVTTFYDPLLVKVAAHAETRDEAIARLGCALAETTLLGVKSNIGFLGAVLRHPTFRAGEATTRFIETEMRDWKEGFEAEDIEAALVAAALTETREAMYADGARAQGNDPYSPWHSGVGKG